MFSVQRCDQHNRPHRCQQFVVAETVPFAGKRLLGIRLLLLGIALFMISGASGCLHRRMTIASNPPGAQVLLDGEEIGQTPVSVDFTHYGTREIRLIKDGFQTKTVMQKVRTPWYQMFPLDFVTDNFLPFNVTNRHSFLYNLHPQRHVPKQELLDRARGLRSQSHTGQ